MDILSLIDSNGSVYSIACNLHRQEPADLAKVSHLISSSEFQLHFSNLSLLCEYQQVVNIDNYELIGIVNVETGVMARLGVPK